MSNKVSVSVNPPAEEFIGYLGRPDVVVVFGGNEYASAAEKMQAYKAWHALLLQEAAQKGSGAARSLSCKVSEKGGLSVYGLQRMPVTLYVEQWDRLLNFAP